MTGVTFSGTDIDNFADGDEGSMKFVESGTKRYAVEVTNLTQMKGFDKNNDITGMWTNIYNSSPEAMGSAALAATRNVVNQPNSGMKLYQTVDPKKLDFVPVK